MRPLLLLVLLCAFAQVSLAQPVAPATPVIVILSFTGKISYTRANMTTRLPLQVGQFLDATAVIYPDATATLRVVCPNGTAADFLPVNLAPGRPIPCSPVLPVLTQIGEKYLRVQRGGGLDARNPYLIAPRDSLVRTPNVVLVWNAPSKVDNFSLTVRADTEIVWSEPKLTPADVVTGYTAQVVLPLSLVPGIPYTVEICVFFIDLTHGCTTDAGWSSPVDLAFYYVPDNDLKTRLNSFVQNLGANSPETLYAQAAALYLIAPQYGLGYYAEATALLQQLLHDYPDNPLAHSSELYVLLGDLYRRTELPNDAWRAYQSAVTLALPETEAAADALLGNGMTTLGGDEVAFYTRALDTYAGYLTPEAFLTRFQQICTQISDICLSLPQCDTVDGADCAIWSKQKTHPKLRRRLAPSFAR